MRQLLEIADFIRALRRRLRFGEFSRAPLEIVRLELRGDRAECDWVARPADAWDADVPSRAVEECASWQTLADAISLRSLLLHELAAVRTAALRGYRLSRSGVPEMIIASTIERDDPHVVDVPSPAMRAKLCGFEFHLEDGSLQPLEVDMAVAHRSARRTTRETGREPTLSRRTTHGSD